MQWLIRPGADDVPLWQMLLLAFAVGLILLIYLKWSDEE